MLSTATPSNNSSQTLLPSDQPPDPSLASSGPSLVLATGTTTSKMLIDSSATTHQPCPPLAPSQQFSYAKAVTGWKIASASPLGGNQWTPVGANDLIPGERNGEPALNVSPDFKNKICAPWQRTLVVRLLGLKIGFVTLCSTLRSLWKPAGNMEILDLDHDCFLVKLDNEKDYFRALRDGSWVIFDHYLAVQQWTPHFKVSDPLPKKMIVWVQLPALKIHFYHKEVLTTLGNLIGRIIKLDYHTLNRQRAKFARLAVEVDLAKHLVPQIWLDDVWQKVEYENLSAVCFECGKIGHDAAECPQIFRISPPATLAITGLVAATETAEQVVDEPNPGFGPWMRVSRKGRRNLRDHKKKGKSEIDIKSQNQGNQTNSGKVGSNNKERLIPSPTPTSLPKVSQQRSSGQDKKVGNMKKKVEEGKKGKAIMILEMADNSVSILGLGPSRNPTLTIVSKAVSAANRASSSAHLPQCTLARFHPRRNSAMGPPLSCSPISRR
ncbi:unnamed protein product [Linum trigynum]|uniref:CCHC-type domain-containing protein n=1 Tax=Linum trigynum TaxID=586398 RepID=A0AAV2CED6_9ROSI